MDTKKRSAIASNLHNLRNIFGYTQLEISKKLHIARSTYALYETGSKVPNTDVILKLADIYHICTDTIFQSDSSKFYNSLLLSNSTDEYLNYLVGIFHDLSPYSKGCLLERAEVLLKREREMKKSRSGR